MGLMGFQDALYMQDAPYCSDAAIEFADRSMEVISYYAIHASSELAKERGHIHLMRVLSESGNISKTQSIS